MVPKSPTITKLVFPVTNMLKMLEKSTKNHCYASQSLSFKDLICWVCTKHAYLIESGGVNLMIESWVGFARTPLSFNFRQISYAEIGNRLLLLSTTALNKPLPRTSFMWFGYCCWILSSWFLSSCPAWEDL